MSRATSKARGKLFFQIIDPRYRTTAVFPQWVREKWPYPEKDKGGAWTPGAWVETIAKKPIQLVSDVAKHWPDITHRDTSSHLIFVAEYADVVAEEETLIKVRRARLVRPATDAELAAMNVFRKGVHRVTRGSVVALGESVILASGTAKVRACGGFIDARDTAEIEASNGAQVVARDHVSVKASGKCQIRALGEAQVTEARCGAQVIAAQESHVQARGGAQVMAFDEVYVIAEGRNQVYLDDRASLHATGGQIHAAMRSHAMVQGRSQTFAENRSVVQAFGLAHVVAEGGADVYAMERSSVEASQNAQVTARAQSRVEARGSARVVATGRAQVTARGRSQVEIPVEHGTKVPPLLADMAVLVDRRKGALHIRVSEEGAKVLVQSPEQAVEKAAQARTKSKTKTIATAADSGASAPEPIQAAA